MRPPFPPDVLAASLAARLQAAGLDVGERQGNSGAPCPVPAWHPGDQVLLARWLGTAMPMGNVAGSRPRWRQRGAVFAVPASPAQPWSVAVMSVGPGGQRAVHPRIRPGRGGGGGRGDCSDVPLPVACTPPGGASALFAACSRARNPSSRCSCARPGFDAGWSWRWLTTSSPGAGTRTGKRRSPTARPGSQFLGADLDAALAHYNQVLDVSRDDLRASSSSPRWPSRAQLRAPAVCDIMTKAPVTARVGTFADEVWRLMREHCTALPAIDQCTVVGAS